MNDSRNCEQWSESISLAAAGCLAPDEEREVHRHLEACCDCRERFRQLAELRGVLSQLRLPAESAEREIVPRIMSAIVPRTFALVRWRWIMRHPISRVSAAAIFVLAIGAVAWWFYARGETPALAAFLEPILAAKTVTFKMTAVEQGKQMTAKVMVLGPDRTRIEQEMPNKQKMVLILNAPGKTLMLLPDQKRAFFTTYANMPKGKHGSNLFLELRSQLASVGNRPDWIHEPLGEKEIDGHRLVGYRLTGHGMILNLWGDAQTRMPVRIEVSAPSNPNVKPAVWSDFVFNAHMDESRFSLEPPAGYKVQRRTVDASPAQEKDLLDTFRRYAALRGGMLPDELDLSAFLQLFMDHWSKSHPGEGGFPSEEQRQERLNELHKFVHGLSFAFEQLPREADAHYAGKGVKLGAADRPIFWYRPKDSTKYRIIYGDLSVREADTAPRVPNAQRIVSASGPKR